MGAACAGVGKRGSVCLDVGFFLSGSFAGIPVVWFIGVRYFTAHWEDLDQITPQGGPHTDRASSAEGTGYYVGVPLAGGGEGRGFPT